MADVGILLLDDRRRFVAVDARACELLGVTPEAIRGRGTDDFVPPELYEAHVTAWHEFTAGTGATAGKFPARRADGSLTAVAYLGHPNRPVRGLHLFVVEPLEEELPPESVASGFGVELEPERRRELERDARWEGDDE